QRTRRIRPPSCTCRQTGRPRYRCDLRSRGADEVQRARGRALRPAGAARRVRRRVPPREARDRVPSNPRRCDPAVHLLLLQHRSFPIVFYTPPAPPLPPASRRTTEGWARARPRPTLHIPTEREEREVAYMSKRAKALSVLIASTLAFTVCFMVWMMF